MFRDIQQFVDALRKEGELVDIEAEVDPTLEIAEVHRRVIAAGGPALLFHHPKGHQIPVVTNLFGTRRRVEMAFGTRPLDFVSEVVDTVQHHMPPKLSELWERRHLIRQGLRLGTRSVRRGPVTEVCVRPPDLSALPMLKSWPEDGGHFLTLPLVYTEHPKTGGHNLGMYRVQRHSAQTAGLHFQIGKGGGYHHHAAQQRGENLPVTVFLGGSPALILASIAPLPENVPELVLGSLLSGNKLRTTGNPAGPHPLLADCEFALVGHVKPNVMQPEGPFGDHYGYYSLTHDYPVFFVDAVCHRKQPIYPATVVGKPRQEDVYIGDYLQELLSPMISMVMPSVKDLWSYGETGYHSLAAAVVEERYRREAIQSAFRILGEGQLSLTKFLWVVHDSIDLKDPKKVLSHILARFRPETDLYVFSNVSMDSLDYTGPEVNLGSKGLMLGIGSPWRALLSEVPTNLPGGVRRAAVYCPGCLVIEGPSHDEDPLFGQQVVSKFNDWPLVVLVDHASKTASSDTRFLWTVFTRFEPASDLYAGATKVHRHHLSYEGPILIDARFKASYPKELFCDDPTRSTVDDRWQEYFPSGGVEMGDSDSGHLDEA